MKLKTESSQKYFMIKQKEFYDFLSLASKMQGQGDGIRMEDRKSNYQSCAVSKI